MATDDKDTKQKKSATTAQAAPPDAQPPIMDLAVDDMEPDLAALEEEDTPGRFSTATNTLMILATTRFGCTYARSARSRCSVLTKR